MLKKHYLLFISLSFLATGCAFAAGPLGLGIVSAAVIYMALAFAACDDSGSSKKGAAPSANEIFVTATKYQGDLGGVSGADDKCASDANNPGDGTVFKAMIAGGGRSTDADWVLKASTEYTRLDGTVIGTTNTSAVFTAPLTNSFSSVFVPVWTGLTAAWATGYMCGGWEYTNLNGFAGYSNATTAYAWSAGDTGCTSIFNLVCVGQ